MKLLFCFDIRSLCDRNNRYYSLAAGWNNLFFERYLTAFEHISVFTRVKYVEQCDLSEIQRIGSERISVIPLPYYHGPYQYLFVRNHLKRTIEEQAKPGRAYILRGPSIVSTFLSKALKTQKIPYALEFVADPYEIFNTMSHPFAYLFRYFGVNDAKYLINNASAAVYVTNSYLQKRYPATENVFTDSISNVALHKEDIQQSVKVYKTTETFKMISIGSLDQMYKAPDIVLNAVYFLKQQGISVNLTWLGDGKFRPKMEQLARKLGIVNQVFFAGNICDRKKVFEYLNNSDLFVLVSLSEGLPRAMIEAMACGLPCIGSNVGGIPELLDSETIIPTRAIHPLVEKIKQFIYDSIFYEHHSRCNLLKSYEFEYSVLEKKRLVFFNEIKRLTNINSETIELRDGSKKNYGID
jgi:glycosyltransferase involved in cell wall biosynthesis